MALKAGNRCNQCKKDKERMLIYSGKDKLGSNNSYQKILKCNACSCEVTED